MDEALNLFIDLHNHLPFLYLLSVHLIKISYPLYFFVSLMKPLCFFVIKIFFIYLYNNNKLSQNRVLTKVLKLGPVQGPGFDLVVRVNSDFFLKNQNNIVLIKKIKVNGLQSGLARSTGSSGHLGF
jgi:hypothetical protein